MRKLYFFSLSHVRSRILPSLICFEDSSPQPPPSSASCLYRKRCVCRIHTMKNLRNRFLKFLRLKRNQHRNQMENEHQKEFIYQRLYYMYDYKCKVNLRIHKLFARECSRSKMEKRRSSLIKRGISLFIQGISQGFIVK